MIYGPQFVLKSSSVFCLEDKKCYVWGNNFYGELGLNDKDKRFTPTLLQNEKITSVASGLHHTIFLTAEHTCYVVGLNEEGERYNSLYYNFQTMKEFLLLLVVIIIQSV